MVPSSLPSQNEDSSLAQAQQRSPGSGLCPCPLLIPPTMLSIYLTQGFRSRSLKGQHLQTSFLIPYPSFWSPLGPIGPFPLSLLASPLPWGQILPSTACPPPLGSFNPLPIHIPVPELATVRSSWCCCWCCRKLMWRRKWRGQWGQVKGPSWGAWTRPWPSSRAAVRKALPQMLQRWRLGSVWVLPWFLRESRLGRSLGQREQG